MIINNYNYARYLPAAVESALGQSWPSCEVIVVDDGSTDDSRGVLEKYRGRVKAIYQPNRGQVAAVNHGYLESSGAAVLFLDADDALAPEAIARAVELLDNGVAKVHFPLQVIDSEGRQLERIMPRARLAAGRLDVAILSKGKYVSPPTSGNLYPRSVLSAIMPIPDRGWDHADFYLNTLAPFFGEVRAVMEPLGFYRVHGGSMSSTQATDGVDLRQISKLIHHDFVQKELIEEFARARNLPVSPATVTGHWSHLKLRLTRAKLLPHAEGGLYRLAAQMIRSAWLSADELAVRSRLEFTAWACLVALLPAPLALPLIRAAFGHGRQAA